MCQCCRFFFFLSRSVKIFLVPHVSCGLACVLSWFDIHQSSLDTYPWNGNDVRQMFPRKTRDVKKKSMTLYAFYPLFAKTFVFSLDSLYDIYLIPAVWVQSGKIILGNTWLGERYRGLGYEFFPCFENWMDRFSFGLSLRFAAVSCSLSRPLCEVWLLPSTFPRSLIPLSCWSWTSLPNDCHIFLYFPVSE